MQLLVASKSIAGTFAEICYEQDIAKTRLECLLQSLTSLGEETQAQDIAEHVEALFATMDNTLDALRVRAAKLDTLTSPEEISAEAARIVAEAKQVRSATLTPLHTIQEDLEEQVQRLGRIAQASSFTVLLAETLMAQRAKEASGLAQADGADTGVDAGTSASTQAATQATVQASATAAEAISTWDDLAPTIDSIITRYSYVMARPEYLTGQSFNVLVTYGTAFLDSVEACAGFEERTALNPEELNQLLTTANQARVLQDLLGRYEQEVNVMRELIAKITEYEAVVDTSLHGKHSAHFATVDEAQAYLTALEQTRAEEQQHKYLSACIDEVMRRHGYDIARSVTLERATFGEHRLFGSAADDEGIHVFVNDAGDAMLEAVSAPDLADLPADATVTIAPTSDPEQAQAMIALQQDFCSVYAEIEAELAAYGVHLDTIHRCAPSTQFSKVVHTQAQQEEAGDRIVATEVTRGMSRSSFQRSQQSRRGQHDRGRRERASHRPPREQAR